MLAEKLSYEVQQQFPFLLAKKIINNPGTFLLIMAAFN